MAGNMEDILMGGGSDSDDSDDNNNKKSGAPKPGGSSSGRTAAPPASSAPPPSKSELTNRLKNLYASPSNAAAQSGGGSASVAPNALPRGGIQVPGGLPNRPPPQQQAPAPSGYGRSSMPPPAAQPPQPQQQPPPPGYHPANHVPAPLPKGRSTARSAPPPNRMASVPQGQYHQQPHHPSQQPPPGYHPSSGSRPPSSSQYPQQHHQSAPRSSSSRQSMPPQHMQQPPPSQAQQRPSMTQQQMQMKQQQMKEQQMKQQQSRPSSSSRSSSVADASASGGKELTEQEKKEKEKFLMFTRVLMKYLEQRDKEMHQKAKAQIKECYEKNKLGDPMFKSLTQSMKARLRATVGELYWKKAHDYLEHFFRQKTQKKDENGQPAPTSSSGLSPSQSPALPSSNNPGSSRSASQPSSSRHLTQSQQAAAMKMPLPNSSRSSIGGTSAAGASSSAAGASVSTASSAPLTSAEAIAAAKEKADKEKKAKAEKNRRRREAAKKKKEDEAAAALAARKAQTDAGTGMGLPLIAPLNPSAATMLGSTPGATPSTIGTSSISTAASAASKKDKDSKTKKTLKHSSSISSVGSLKKKAPATKEFSQDMDQLDHAILIDVKSLPNLLAKEFISDVNLNEEQRKLLYGDNRQQFKVKQITDAAAKLMSSDELGAKLKEKGVPPLEMSVPNMYTGWGAKNVVSTRTAWSKVRLPERENIMIEREKDAAEKANREKPMGEPGQDKMDIDDPTPTTAVSMPTDETQSSAAVEATSANTKDLPMLKLEDDTTNHVWYNEARASQDPALALLSEATELYLKSAIEKAIGNARLRQNLDGVRLWNTLQSYTNPKYAGADCAPPAVIRLGCDVRRQVALAEGNAAKIYQRMEEAISRQNDNYHTDSADLDPNTMILESTSMADLSRKPPLRSAEKNADVQAKRKFEVYGGKHSNEPPLGRVPKQAKVLLQDMAIGSMGNRSATNRARKMNMMASLFS